jgi:hypothetical protein
VAETCRQTKKGFYEFTVTQSMFPMQNDSDLPHELVALSNDDDGKTFYWKFSWQVNEIVKNNVRAKTS